MASLQNMIDTKIAQIAQQVSRMSHSQGQLPGQHETNPRGHVIALSAVGEGLEESLMMVLQETVLVPDSAGTEEQKEEESLSFSGKVSPSPPVRPYQPRIPFLQRIVWAKLLKLEPKFTRFLDMLKRIYADIPFLETLKRAPVHLQFLRELLFKKGEPEGCLVVPIRKVYSAVLQSQLPP